MGGLVLSLKGRDHASGVSGPDGIARFHRLSPGNYYLEVRADLRTPTRALLQIRSDGPVNSTVPLSWPGIAPISIRSLKGAIHGPVFSPQGNQPSAWVDLVVARTGEVLRNFRTAARGEFDLPNVPAGLYFLAIRSFEPQISGGDGAGAIAVEVDSAAPAARMDVDFSLTSCGLVVSTTRDCPTPSLSASRIAGRVTNLAGEGLARSRVTIMSQEATSLDQVETDSAGAFASDFDRPGMYILDVDLWNFTTLRATVTVEASANLSIFSPLVLRLGQFGTCGVASGND